MKMKKIIYINILFCVLNSSCYNKSPQHSTRQNTQESGIEKRAESDPKPGSDPKPKPEDDPESGKNPNNNQNPIDQETDNQTTNLDQNHSEHKSLNSEPQVVNYGGRIIVPPPRQPWKNNEINKSPEPLVNDKSSIIPKQPIDKIVEQEEEEEEEEEEKNLPQRPDGPIPLIICSSDNIKHYKCYWGDFTSRIETIKEVYADEIYLKETTCKSYKGFLKAINSCTNGKRCTKMQVAFKYRDRPNTCDYLLLTLGDPEEKKQLMRENEKLKKQFEHKLHEYFFNRKPYKDQFCLDDNNKMYLIKGSEEYNFIEGNIINPEYTKMFVTMLLE